MGYDINELFVCFNSSTSNDNTFRVKDSSLEFLNDIGAEIVDIASKSLNRHSKVASSKGSLENIICENLISAQMRLKLVAVGVFVHSYA